MIRVVGVIKHNHSGPINKSCIVTLTLIKGSIMKKRFILGLFVIFNLTQNVVNAACTETQTALINKLFYQGFSGGNMEVIDDVFHPEFTLDHPSLPPGIEGVKTIVRMNNNAFEGWHFTIHDLLCDGNKVVARYTGSGTHVNPFMGEQPTGKTVNLNGISIIEIKDNRIIRDWYAPDELNFFIQIGLIPPMAPPEGE